MGIETMLVLGLLVVVVALVAGVNRAKRKAMRRNTGNPPTSSTGPRQG